MTQREVVENLGEQLRHFLTIFAFDFAFKPVHLVHHITFMVSSRQVEVIWIEQLKTEQREDRLNRERASIHKVTIKELKI